MTAAIITGTEVYTGNVWVAQSTSNGTLFSYTEAAYSIALDSPAWYPAVNPTSFGPFQTPEPQMAYNPLNDTLYLAFTGGRMAGGSTECFYSTPQCLTGGLYFYTSYDNATSFNPGNIRSTVFDPDYIQPWTAAANATDSVTSLALAVEPSGQVDLEAGFYNGSACFGTTCGAATEVVFSTSDNGTTFTIPATSCRTPTRPTRTRGTARRVRWPSRTARPSSTGSRTLSGLAQSPCGPYPSAARSPKSRSPRSLPGRGRPSPSARRRFPPRELDGLGDGERANRQRFDAFRSAGSRPEADSSTPFRTLTSPPPTTSRRSRPPPARP